MIEYYKETLDFLKQPLVLITIILSLGVLNFEQAMRVLSICG